MVRDIANMAYGRLAPLVDAGFRCVIYSEAGVSHTEIGEMYAPIVRFRDARAQVEI